MQIWTETAIKAELDRMLDHARQIGKCAGWWPEEKTVEFQRMAFRFYNEK